MSFAGAVAVVGVLGTAVIYGSDVFALLVLRPAGERAADASIADLVGWIHHYGDRRLPVPFAVAVVAVVAAGTGSVLGVGVARAGSAVALVALLTWLVLFVRVSAPVNRLLRAAAGAGTVPSDTRAMQRRWDSVLWARAGLQGIALVALLAAAR
ncbi:DUF1772 domain-containing protein [Pseudonocardia cypriaca]|uniref:DUF1772 domain-containing protein n=1 Tax=Pseudonocardia cypriaca TaxID=882449 RepID=A0A543FR41_9PSEU|nr:DUF1772 domain-containing protein [Pseudonocardia cypriaca]TQM36310.1 hypothetical protein FB388_7767 [Pseudonocardia cypriaca]